MIRILQIVSAMNMGGIETYIMNNYRLIDKEKIQFDFLLFEKNETYYEKEIKEMGGRIYKIELTKNPILNIIIIKKQIKQINNVTTVHMHSSFFNGIISIAAKLAGVKKIISHSHTSADSKENTFFRKLYRNINRTLIKTNATDFLACSKEAAMFLYGKDSNLKTTILNNGIDTNLYEKLEYMELKKAFCEKYNINENTLILGNVGKLRKVKNQQFIIKVIKDLKKDNEKIVCFIIGDGELENELKRKVKEENLEKNIIFTGLINNVNEYMKFFDIFLFPSLYEGFGIVLLEAQAAGTKCIVSNNIPRAADIGMNLIKYIDIR